MTPEEEREIRAYVVEYSAWVFRQEVAPAKEADWIVRLLAALGTERERNAKLERVVEGARKERASWNNPDCRCDMCLALAALDTEETGEGAKE